MKKKLFLLAFALYSGFAFCTTITVVNVGMTFSSATVTITLGDSVKFQLANIHQPLEVSQATWNANSNTALAGGFSTPFGGGLVLPANLTVGTHYYVCSAHYSMGMKGVIIVQNAAGIAENKLLANISIFPNPTNGKFTLTVENKQSLINKMDLEIYNLQGAKVNEYTNLSGHQYTIDLSSQPSGIYFLKIINQDGSSAIRKIIRE